MNSKNFKEIYDSMKSNFTTHCKKITDFNEGSIIRTIFESISSIIEEIYVDARIGFSSNLKECITSIFDFKKKDGVKATVQVKFGRNKASETISRIPSGTKISDGSHIFITGQIATIPQNETESNLVYAQAEKIGVDYNVNEGSINNIDSPISDEIVSVTNPNKATGGADDESDTNHLIRFKNYINGLQGNNIYGMKNGILSIEGVRSVGIEEHFPPENDIYNATVYIDDGSGNLTESLKEKIETVINGNETLEHPGLKAAGIQINVKPATQVLIKISAKVTIYRVDTSQARYNIENTLKTYINSLQINEDVILAQVQNALMASNKYIHDIKELKLNNSFDSIRIGINQIPIYDSMDIEIEVKK